MPYPHAALAPRGAVAAWATLGATLTAGFVLVMSLLGAALGSASPQAAVAGRGLLALAGVVLAVRIVCERGARLGLANLPLAAAAVAVGGYLLDPLTWSGRAGLTQLIDEPGLTTLVGDLALWQVAASLGIVWGLRNLGTHGNLSPHGSLSNGSNLGNGSSLEGDRRRISSASQDRRRPFGRDHDRGAATVEWTGALTIAAVLVLAVSLAVSAQLPGVGNYVRWAVCEVLTLGQGSCGSPSTTAQDHVPTTPCVVSSSASTISRDVEVLIVKGEGGNTYELARLSDGRYRVTELVSGSAGVETGVGGGVTVNVNDNVFGASATADVSGLFGVSSGRVWYVTSPAEANRLIGTLRGNAIQDTVTGGSGPASWLWSLGRAGIDAVTGHDSGLPTPDETYAQGGLTLNASAEATSVVLHGSGSAGSSTVIGTRQTADGHTTVYLRTDLSAGVATQTLTLRNHLDGARASGAVQLVTAATFDNAGQLVEVSATGAAGGETAGLVAQLFGGDTSASLANQQAGGVVYRASLPVHTPQDAVLASSFLADVGATQLLVGLPGATGGLASANLVLDAPRAVDAFLTASKDRGVITQQSFGDNTGGLGATAQGKLGIELGGGLQYSTVQRTSTGASYWDGQSWVPWTACG